MQILDLKDEPQYIPTLAYWHHHEWWSLNPGCSVEQRMDSMKSHLTDELAPSTFIAVGSELLGSASIVENDMDTKPELSPWLASVFVAPEFRNQGIGSRLVRHAMCKAKAVGVEMLYLFTHRVTFYQNLGWRILSHEQYYGHSVTVMYVELGEI